jgi:hypothetical protein
MTIISRTVIAIAVVSCAIARPDHALSAELAAAPSAATYGMSQHVDPAYGFSFWYPSALKITAAAAASDAESFPGGVVAETVQVGDPGGVSISVVNSPTSTITDEPNGHAAPHAQTRYFYDAAARKWMVAYPEGRDDGGSTATTAADVSNKTIGGLPMLPSDARFDTTIIPLSPTRFIVVQDGGGSEFTNELARTVAPAAATIDPAARSAALQAEAAAYKKQ